MNLISKTLAGFIVAMLLAFAPQPECRAMEGPDSVQIDSIAQLFGPVTFDHSMHVGVAENGCADCHHHTTGTPVKDPLCAKCHAKSGAAAEVSCQGCHVAKRFDADNLKRISEDNKLYHTDKVGLKAAYHIRCMGCHEEVGAPVGCTDCHQRVEAGDQYYRSGKFAPPPPAKGSHSAHGGH
jgi:hypothetical protein